MRYPKINNNKGFVFIITLISLFILMLLTFASLKILAITSVQTHRMWDHAELEADALYVLHKIKKQVQLNIPACRVNSIDKMNLDGFKEFGCSGNHKKYHYFYMIEDNERLTEHVLTLGLLFTNGNESLRTYLETKVVVPTQSIRHLMENINPCV